MNNRDKGAGPFEKLRALRNQIKSDSSQELISSDERDAKTQSRHVRTLRQAGVIRYIDPQRKFGLVVADNHSEPVLFFPSVGSHAGIRDIVEGEVVSCIIVDANFGSYAFQVRKPPEPERSDDGGLRIHFIPEQVDLSHSVITAIEKEMSYKLAHYELNGRSVSNEEHYYIKKYNNFVDKLNKNIVEKSNKENKGAIRPENDALKKDRGSLELSPDDPRYQAGLTAVFNAISESLPECPHRDEFLRLLHACGNVPSGEVARLADTAEKKALKWEGIIKAAPALYNERPAKQKLPEFLRENYLKAGYLDGRMDYSHIDILDPACGASIRYWARENDGLPSDLNLQPAIVRPKKNGPKFDPS